MDGVWGLSLERSRGLGGSRGGGGAIQEVWGLQGGLEGSQGSLGVSKGSRIDPLPLCS